MKFDVEPYKNGSPDIIISLVTQYITGKDNIFPLSKLTYAKLLMDGFNIIVLIKRTVMKFKYSIFCVS